jgi:hypothetical protein
MVGDLVIPLCRTRGRAAQELAEKPVAWKQSHSDSLPPREVEGWAAEGVAEGRLVVALSRQTHRLLGANELQTNIDETGTSLEQMLDACDRLCASIAGLVAQVQAGGSEVQGQAEFAQVCQQVAKELDRVRRRWPHPDPEPEDVDAGRCREIDNLIRELRRNPIPEEEKARKDR